MFVLINAAITKWIKLLSKKVWFWWSQLFITICPQISNIWKKSNLVKKNTLETCSVRDGDLSLIYKNLWVGMNTRHTTKVHTMCFVN